MTAVAAPQVRKTDFTETLGGICNLLGFLAVAIPVLAGPDFVEPPFLGDLTKYSAANLNPNP